MTTVAMSYWPADTSEPVLETTVGGVLRAAAAAARSTPPTVVSSTGSEVSAGQYDIATVVIAASPDALIISRRAGETGARATARSG